MNEVAHTMGKLIEEYYKKAIDNKLECRFLVPGLTVTIANQVQEYLVSKEIISYLVVDRKSMPDFDKGWLHADGLTSKREGSMVIISYPGELDYIQDSIKGSGGTIRSMAFSDEWPWINDGNESFKFDGIFVENLILSWTSDRLQQELLKDLIVNVLVPGTGENPRRAEYLLDALLGKFSSSLYEELNDRGIVMKLLFHCGIPSPSSDASLQSIKDFEYYINDTRDLCKKILEDYKGDTGKRGEIKERVAELYHDDEEEQERLRNYLDIFFDGLGEKGGNYPGILGLASCWGDNSSGLWQELNAGILRKLFNIPRGKETELDFDIVEFPGLFSKERKTLATFHGRKFNIQVEYSLPDNSVETGNFEIRLIHKREVILKEVLTSNSGTIELLIDTGSFDNYNKKIILRLTLVSDDRLLKEKKLNIHLCGEKRSNFMLVDYNYEVVDALLGNPEQLEETLATDEGDIKKLEISEPTHIYLFSNEPEKGISLHYDYIDEGHILELEEYEHGILRSNSSLDPAEYPGGRINAIALFAGCYAILTLEASDIKRGEFTLEDELRVNLQKGKKGGNLKKVIDIFSGKSREPYPMLGQVDDTSLRRIYLARRMEENEDGWKPILVDFITPGVFEGESLPSISPIRFIGKINGISSLQEPIENKDVLSLIDKYILARTSLIEYVKKHLLVESRKLDRPCYAAFPVFVENEKEETENLLMEYLESYIDILKFLKDNRNKLKRNEIFTLAYLDCVVNWSDGEWKNALFLMGPWHPLVVVKMYMVQLNLYYSAMKFQGDKQGNNFHKLAALLENVNSFRWFPALHDSDNVFQHSYVSATSDPGWLLAFKVGSESVGVKKLSSVFSKINRKIGLDTSFIPLCNDYLASSYLTKFFSAYPTRRSVGALIEEGYSAEKIIEAVNILLYEDPDEGNLTRLGKQLPGGIQLYFKEEPDEIEQVPQLEPRICVFKYTEESSNEAHVSKKIDIQLLPPLQKIEFSWADEIFPLPRGEGNQGIFFSPLYQLSESISSTPQSFIYEGDNTVCEGSDKNLGEVYKQALCRINELLSRIGKLGLSPSLREKLPCPWTILPGLQVDPALFVKYVRDGFERDIQERALWDYNVDVQGKLNTFYILSTVSPGIINSLNGSPVLGGQNIASEIIRELGEVGIAIGSEATMTGRKALGVIGLIGGIRLFKNGTDQYAPPLLEDDSHIGLLLPVDSFKEFFEIRGEEPATEPRKRADLLAIQLEIPQDTGQLLLSFCAIECKYVSGIFPESSVERALAQARETYELVSSMAKSAKNIGGIPERLALVNLVSFGLRLCSKSGPGWIKKESRILSSLLKGNYEVIDPSDKVALITTECGLEKAGLGDTRDDTRKLWVRLSPGNWPGITEGQELEQIRQRLAGIFNYLNRPSAPIDVVPTEVQEPAEPEVVVEESDIAGQSTASESAEISIVPDETTPEITPHIVPEVPRDFIGWNQTTARWTLIGKLADMNSPVALDLDNPKAIGIFGYMGSGKSYLVGNMIESALEPISRINSLSSPLAVVIFNYRRQAMDRFELSSLAFPNSSETDLSRLRAEYGASPLGIRDLHILCLPGELREQRLDEYRQIPASELFFDPATLTVEDWELLMGEPGSDAVFARTIRNALRNLRTERGISLDGVEHYISSNLRGASLNAARLRMDFVRQYLSRERGINFEQLVRPGRAVIIDLRQPLFNKDDALRFFLVCANYVSQVQGRFNKMIVFDEAHEYMSDMFGDRIEARIRQMRHEGTTYVFATQDVVSIPSNIRKFITTRFVFNLGTRENVDDMVRFAPEFKDSQLTGMESGTCLAQSIYSVGDYFKKPRKAVIRPRATLHGGDSRIFPGDNPS